MQAEWLFPALDASAVEALSAALGIRRLTARILLSRGLGDAEQARRFLTPSLDHLHDPYLMADMAEAVARLRKAIAASEQILIYGDYDVDGTTSVVMLKKAIELAGGTASFHVPHRLREGYGMRAEVLERALASGVRLVVSVDTGIRALEVARAAQTMGLDVIVTDHHLPEAELPAALAILNPNRPGCGYPEKNLCGAGVAFKLVQALLGSLGWPAAKLERMLRSFLKLAAIATVADVVPLLGENRVMVKHGLEGLIQVNNPGLRALMEVSRLLDGGAPSAHEVAFQIAPRINAAGRMAHAEDVIHLFLTSDPGEARRLAGQLHELNQERQQTEAGMVKAILDECIQKPVTDQDAALVFSCSGWHRGVVGIVASRLTERFCRPVFVLSEEEEEAQGSGRSIPAFHLLEALEAMPDLFTRFGGHRQAAGVGMRLERVAEFRQRLNAYASARLHPEDFRPRLSIDAVATLAELDDEAAAEILGLAPFGFGNPAPVVAALRAEVSAPPAVLKEKHLRMRFQQGGRHLAATAWRFAERVEECAQGRAVDIAFCLEEDSYGASRGWAGWRAVLKDLREAATARAVPAGAPAS